MKCFFVFNLWRNCNVMVMLECYCLVDGRCCFSEGISDDMDRMEVNFECLDLNFFGDEFVID